MRSPEPERMHHGRGSHINPANRFDKLADDPSTEADLYQGAEKESGRTEFIKTHPKTIVNRVDSPDIGMNWSLNPYQGCEHGCAYCYARVTHAYWGYSPGLDFESRIMVKHNAPVLLRKLLSSRTWQGEPVMLSGNTDCYQPVERKLGITRQLLEVMWQHRQCVGIVTKNDLVVRDIDILEQMAAERLVKVSLSINGLDENIRRKLEPRTSTFARRIEAVRKLSDAGIPVNVMLAPVIPGLNDHEIFDVVKAVAEAGALTVKHIVVRLNGEVLDIFNDWLQRNFPDRYDKVIHRVSEVHGGSPGDSRFGIRMKGQGHYAKAISDQVRLARNRYLMGREMPSYNTELYLTYRDRQMSLF